MSDTYYLVCFHEDLSQEGANFISDCLTRPQTKGGAELICSAEKWEEGCGGLILHISGNCCHFHVTFELLISNCFISPSISIS